MVGIENIKAAREILKCSIEKSRELGVEISNRCWRLESCEQRLDFLAGALRNLACKCTLYKMSGHDVDRVIGPAASVVKIFDVICELENSLSTDDPSDDISAYVTTLKWMEEALSLLTDNCKLVVSWLETSSFNSSVAESWYVVNVNKCLSILRELQATEEHFRAKGGPLTVALDKVEVELASLLKGIAPLSLPLPDVIQNVQAIIDRLAANHRLDRCMSIYVEVRRSNVRKAVEELDLDYLEEISFTEFDSVLSVEPHIDLWAKHLEFAVKYLLDTEHRLCIEVFRKAAFKERCMDCFAKIAVQSGIHSFIKFGNTITKGKKEAIKLLKLLEMFAALNKLRSNFNRLFSGRACGEIQTQTRDLVKRVVNGTCEIFWELSLQVELQRPTSPPVDGSVPRLVNFVTEYCNQLLEDEYWSTLVQVVEIHQGWNNENFGKELLVNEMQNIVTVIGLNLETWTKRYEDVPLSYFFLMNNHWYLFKYTRGTKLGEIMGHEWITGHEEYMEYYETHFLKESWGKLPSLLSEEGLVLFPGGRAIDRQLVKKRLKEFTESFDEIYKKQSSWELCDKGLRWRVCQNVLHVVVPSYINYLEKYMPSIEFEVASTTDQHIKYTAKTLVNMITCLFEPKVGNYGSSTKCTELSGKLNNSFVTNQLSSTPAAA
ncbi:putative WRKY transcription factor [Capsicum annuum]|uniref:exocyst complex component EXO70A1-like n=1 Tax=Capsicum annuum TaxID=4072 RepID=UPI001FB1248E|nr:exocyst complex component EXO70A1-like [Capsicum annuum]KAF3634383.1 putative WRKY transcription factor [Capsicum annuum]